MYICVCKAVSVKRIELSVEQGVRKLKDLREMTGLGSCCGKCVPEARRCLADAVARRCLADALARQDAMVHLGQMAAA